MRELDLRNDNRYYPKDTMDEKYAIAVVAIMEAAADIDSLLAQRAPLRHEHSEYASAFDLSDGLGGKSDVTHGHLLDDLVNVTIAGIADGHTLEWDSGTSKWINALASAAGTVGLNKVYSGTGANNREIDLGDDYDLVLIFSDSSLAGNADHCAMAWAYKTSYGCFSNTGASNDVRSRVAASANTYFQGKMFTSGDEDKIKLGSGGTQQEGTNLSGRDFRIMGLQFGTLDT